MMGHIRTAMGELPLACRHAAIVCTCAMLVAWPNASRLSAQDTVRPPRFSLRVPNPPTVVNGETGAFLVYELHLTNFTPQQWTLQKVEVLSGSPNPRVLHTLAERELGLATFRPGTTIATDQRRVFAGAAWGVVGLWVPVDRNAPPATISHRVTLMFDTATAPATRDLQGGDTTVHRTTVTIGPPLRGGPWRVAGFTNLGRHRQAIFGYGGDATINARFAIDYFKVGDDNRVFSGDRMLNENHHAYGQDVVAVADGLIAEMREGLADNDRSKGPQGPPNLDTILGNHIFLEIAPRVYATYVHLKPGSLRVAKGQRVRRGEVIASVGNTGSSDGPHLHFQLSGDPSVRSEGLPYAHQMFEVVGRCKPTASAGVLFGPSDPMCARVPPEIHRGEMPLEGMLLQFPDN